MAGFAGYINLSGRENTLREMLHEIRNKGEDYQIEYHGNTLHMGLDGLDTTYAFDRKELFEDEDTVTLLVGYLKNIDEIRDYLAENYRLSSRKFTPAQAGAALYARLGTKAFPLFRGPFLYLFYNKKNNQLLILNDQLGRVRAYYYPCRHGLIFASQIKGFLPHPAFEKKLNTDAVFPYLVLQYPGLEEAFLKGVHILFGGNYLLCDEKGVHLHSYSKVAIKPEKMELEEAKEELNRLIGESWQEILRHFNKPESIGGLLSGGVDSAYMLGRFHPNHTYTVGYQDQEFSEIDRAREIADYYGVENKSWEIGPEDVLKYLPTIAWLLDFPFANLSALPMYFLIKNTRPYTHACVTGGESDDFFGGMYDYTVPLAHQRYRRLVPESLRIWLGKWAGRQLGDFKGKSFLIKGMPTRYWYVGASKVYQFNEANAILKPAYQSTGKLEALLSSLYDQVEGQPELVQKQYVDNFVWMPHDTNADQSVQLVEPIADERVYDFSCRIPLEFKVQGDTTKYLFRQAARDYLPENWSQRKKVGFIVPMRNWLKEEKFGQRMYEICTSDLAREFFDIDWVNRLFDLHLAGKRLEHRKIWNIVMFLEWYTEFFVKR